MKKEKETVRLELTPEQKQLIKKQTGKDAEAVELSVVFPICLSSSCSTDRQTSCTLARSGNTFAVTAKGSFHEAGSGACTTDCAVLNPSCTTPTLSEGTFTFQYAGGSIDIVVPSTVPPPCTGTAFGG